MICPKWVDFHETASIYVTHWTAGSKFSFGVFETLESYHIVDVMSILSKAMSISNHKATPGGRIRIYHKETLHLNLLQISVSLKRANSMSEGHEKPDPPKSACCASRSVRMKFTRLGLKAPCNQFCDPQAKNKRTPGRQRK